MQYPSSKLPSVGTTIFTEMSQLAAQHNAINLSQGFPDFDGPLALLDRVTYYLENGYNQYAPMTGVASLRNAIAVKCQRMYGCDLNPETEITVTSGATEALFAAISAVVKSGDEVIVFDPAYDSYEPAIELNGGRAVHIPLQAPDFAVNWQQVADAISDRTRMIIINTPHNPTGAVWDEGDMQQLEALLQGTDILLLSDEVYEHICFEGEHQSLLRRPALAERAFVVSSFGKTYHTTGWKVGYCVAPEPLSREFRKLHQYLTFCTVHPVQLALADFINDYPEHYETLPDFYRAKRDYFNQQMADSRFSFTPAAGTYFQLMDYSAIQPDMTDLEFCHWLTREAGVAAIPVSVFYQQPPADQRLVRFCFAKDDSTLALAAEKLSEI